MKRKAIVAVFALLIPAVVFQTGGSSGDPTGHAGGASGDTTPGDGDRLTRVQRQIEESEYSVTWQMANATVSRADDLHGAQLSASSTSLRPDLTPDGVPAEGWERVLAQLRQAQYDARPAGDGTDTEWLLTNAGLGIEARLARDGVTIGPRGSREDAGWKWGMRLSGFGPVDAVSPVAQPEVVARGNRVEYRRPGLTEWYVNERRGLEQGFTIDRAPAGDPEQLVLQPSSRVNQSIGTRRGSSTLAGGDSSDRPASADFAPAAPMPTATLGARES